MIDVASDSADPGRSAGILFRGERIVNGPVPAWHLRWNPGDRPMLIRFWRDRRGATAIEYCLIAGLVSLAVVAGATAVGTKLSADYFGKFGSALS